MKVINAQIIIIIIRPKTVSGEDGCFGLILFFIAQYP